jgi:16S rRNA (guanine(527)-N(7))-methyltransferase RsmG
VKLLPNETIIRAIQPYGITASSQLCDQIRVYIDLLLRWNQKTSLTTVTQPEDIARFHFGESLLAVPSVPIRHGRLADVGSGAGFPAVPIRMVSKDLSVILIESNQKKATFLAEVVRELQLGSVEVRRSRMEDASFEDEPVDYVSARAVRIDDGFLDWSRQSLNSGGSLVLWLGEDDAAKISGNPAWKWEDLIRIPHSERRVILRGTEI